MRKIVVTGDVRFGLPEIMVGRACAFEAEVVGLRKDLSNIQFSFGTESNESGNAVACDLRPDGTWLLYANGAFFQHVGVFSYYVTGRTSRDDQTFLGRGKLEVVQSVSNVEKTAVPLIPDDTYVRGANGLYYPLRIELDESGVPYPVIGEGVTK